MDRHKVVVMLDNGHAQTTPGKRSPEFDKEWQEKYGIRCFREYAYNRLIVSRLMSVLSNKYGIEVFDVTPESHVDVGLTTRANRVNKKYDEAKKQGKKGIFISIHVNAAGNGNWRNATGWSVWTTKGKTNSDIFAEYLANAAEDVLIPLGQKVRTDKSDGDKDYEANFTVIYKTKCVSVLTENMFMDSKKDVEFLLSEEGKKAIVDLHVKGILKYIDSL